MFQAYDDYNFGQWLVTANLAGTHDHDLSAADLNLRRDEIHEARKFREADASRVRAYRAVLRSSVTGGWPLSHPRAHGATGHPQFEVVLSRTRARRGNNRTTCIAGRATGNLTPARAWGHLLHVHTLWSYQARTRARGCVVLRPFSNGGWPRWPPCARGYRTFSPRRALPLSKTDAPRACAHCTQKPSPDLVWVPAPG